MGDVNILGIVGSLRKNSYNRWALRAAQELLPDGATLHLMELHGIPLFDQDNETPLPTSVLSLKTRILEADAIIFATPEYNYSIPGVLKNAIDAASRPYGDSAWAGKPAAIIGASPSNLGTARAQYHLRQVLVSLDMPVLNTPEVMIANANQRFDANGKLTDEPTRKQLKKLLHALVQFVRITTASQSETI